MLERNDVLGGAIRTERRAHRAGLHARADGVVAPALRGVGRLRRAGRRPRRATASSTSTPTLPTATLFPDGGAAFLTTSLEDNVAEFERHAAGDGAAWERQFEQFMASAEHSFGVLSAELWSTQGLDLARKAYSSFGRRGLLAFAGTLARERARLARARRSSPSAPTACSRPGCCTRASGPEQARRGLHDAGHRLRASSSAACPCRKRRRRSPRRGARGDRARERRRAAHGRRRRSHPALRAAARPASALTRRRAHPRPRGP